MNSTAQTSMSLLRTGIGGHQRGYEGATDEWLTPPEIIHSLGSFDLDPCSPVIRPWSTAVAHYTVEDDGLQQPWTGRVWCNPPYGPETGIWLQRLADHGDGIALIFARTETDMFHRFVWSRADSILFLRGRLHFYSVRGERAPANAGAPSVLVAYGKNNTTALHNSGINGHMVQLRHMGAEAR